MSQGLDIREKLIEKHEKNPAVPYFPLKYCLVNRDPCNGLLRFIIIPI